MPVLHKPLQSAGFLRRSSVKLMPTALAVIVLALGPLSLVAYACSGVIGGGGQAGTSVGGANGSPPPGGVVTDGSVTGPPAPTPTPTPPAPETPPATPPPAPQAGGGDGSGAETPSPAPGPSVDGSDPATDGSGVDSATGSKPPAQDPPKSQDSPSRGGQGAAPRGEVEEDRSPSGGSARPRGEQIASNPGAIAVGSSAAQIPSSVSSSSSSAIKPSVESKSGKAGAESEGSIDGALAPAQNAAQLNERTTIARTVDGIPLIFRAALLLLIFATSVLAIVSLRERRRATSAARVAQLDHLTGLANREGFDRQMAIEWERALRHGRPLGLVFVDLDNFKEFNDTHGHVAGDRLLREVAAAITATSRASDFTARLGGDEFVIICPDADSIGLDRLVDRLRVEAAGMAVTLSIGAAGKQDADQTSDDLVHRADIAMYRAKGGRRRAVTSGNPMLGSLRRA